MKYLSANIETLNKFEVLNNKLQTLGFRISNLGFADEGAYCG